MGASKNKKRQRLSPLKSEETSSDCHPQPGKRYNHCDRSLGTNRGETQSIRLFGECLRPLNRLTLRLPSKRRLFLQHS